MCEVEVENAMERSERVRSRSLVELLLSETLRIHHCHPGAHRLNSGSWCAEATRKLPEISCDSRHR